jgi:prenylcysteine oxidase / farnesylcysteine lyase
MTRLAVIGAGVGGCAAAYFARSYFPDSEITLYEASNAAGGRILTFKEEHLNLEVGATFFHPSNKVISLLIKKMGLQVRDIKEGMNFAIWNGSKIIFDSNHSSVLTFLRLLSRYGPNVVRTLPVLRDIKKKMASLYLREEENPAEIEHLLNSVELDKWYNKPFDETLRERSMSTTFIDEVITPITRMIYAQEANLSGFAGLASLFGVYSRPIYSLTDGNMALPIGLAKASRANLELGQRVESIEKTPEGSFRVKVGNDKPIFDGAIIATPLELAGIEFKGGSTHELGHNTYQRVYRKIMWRNLEIEELGLTDPLATPFMIMTTRESGSVTHVTIQKSTNGESLLDISSTKPLAGNLFGRSLREGTTIFEHTWNAAYPIYRPVQKLPLTRLDRRLMYLNSIESVVSSMETSALSALNAVRLLRQELS